MSKGIHYYAVEQVVPHPWVLQGTVYPKLEDAKFSAMKLLCNTTGVIVKRAKDGWTIFWWRNVTVPA